MPPIKTFNKQLAPVDPEFGFCAPFAPEYGHCPESSKVADTLNDLDTAKIAWKTGIVCGVFGCLLGLIGGAIALRIGALGPKGQYFTAVSLGVAIGGSLWILGGTAGHALTSYQEKQFHKSLAGREIVELKGMNELN